MPAGLHRTYGARHLHFITCSCYRRLPLFRSAKSQDRFLSILEQTRQRYCFVVIGYVVMPEHVHPLLTEPEVGSPSTVMLQLIKKRSSTVKVRAILRAAKEPEDDKFLECADAARADYLVTGNLNHFPRFWKKTKVITPAEFITIVAPHFVE